ncbi:MAG: hypothetical protein F6J87_18685 [Spirulina sp. SIO3F2]|nr:hypothetical protein [Spirulina sp. SIO3F2]
MPSPFTINLLQGSITFTFAAESAQGLKRAIAELMQELKTTTSQQSQGGQRSRPQPKNNMEYRSMGAVFFEAFCNPNIYPSPFAAKVLITVRDDKIRLSGEAELPRLIEDLNLYLANLEAD